MRGAAVAGEDATLGETVVVGQLFRVRSGREKRFVAKRPETPTKRPAKVALQLALAHRIRMAIESGEIQNQAEAALRLGLTRARVSQLLDLTLIAPDIQEKLLLLNERLGERALRGIAHLQSWAEQRATFYGGASRGLLERFPSERPQLAELPGYRVPLPDCGSRRTPLSDSSSGRQTTAELGMKPKGIST